MNRKQLICIEKSTLKGTVPKIVPKMIVFVVCVALVAQSFPAKAFENNGCMIPPGETEMRDADERQSLRDIIPLIFRGSIVRGGLNWVGLQGTRGEEEEADVPITKGIAPWTDAQWKAFFELRIFVEIYMGKKDRELADLIKDALGMVKIIVSRLTADAQKVRSDMDNLNALEAFHAKANSMIPDIDEVNQLVLRIAPKEYIASITAFFAKDEINKTLADIAQFNKEAVSKAIKRLKASGAVVKGSDETAEQKSNIVVLDNKEIPEVNDGIKKAEQVEKLSRIIQEPLMMRNALISFAQEKQKSGFMNGKFLEYSVKWKEVHEQLQSCLAAIQEPEHTKCSELVYSLQPETVKVQVVKIMRDRADEKKIQKDKEEKKLSAEDTQQLPLVILAVGYFTDLFQKMNGYASSEESNQIIAGIRAKSPSDHPIIIALLIIVVLLVSYQAIYQIGKNVCIKLGRFLKRKFIKPPNKNTHNNRGYVSLHALFVLERMIHMIINPVSAVPHQLPRHAHTSYTSN